MIDVSELDRNLAVSHSIAPEVKNTLDFYDIEQEPFAIYGVFRDGENFVRMPKAVSEKVSEGVHALASHTAGGRIRFVTDSQRVAVHCVCFDNAGMGHFAFAGVCGFDMYAEYEGYERYYGTCVPPVDFKGGYESLMTFPSKELRTVTVNMPLYNGVYKVYIGLDKGCLLEAAEPLSGPPVVYYGSSITQGGCASRPGNCYQAIIHRQLKCDYVNLGFSGNAKAEGVMMDYIAGIPMRMFVYDYDHNAPDAEHLRATHYMGYRTIREKQPDVPIIMMTRPKFYLNEEELERNAVVRATYDAAVGAGDTNVYFIDGRELLDPDTMEHALVDNCHPTDLGFYSMAKRLLPLLKELAE